MKKFFLMMALLMAMSASQAQTANDELTKEINRTIELSNTTTTFTETLRLQFKPLVDQGLIPAEKISPLIKELEQLLVPVLKERMIQLYKENFTLDELKQMNEYLASPLGQKFVKLTPMLSAEGTKIAQSPEMQQKMQQIMMRLLQ